MVVSAVTPVTMPVLPMMATPVASLLHTPPVAASANVIVEPVHTSVGPVMRPDTGAGLTVMDADVVAVAHALVTE